jgi:hypothetical protein
MPYLSSIIAILILALIIIESPLLVGIAVEVMKNN